MALVCFFPIAVNTLDGLRSVDPEAIKLMRTPRRLALADLPPGRGADRAAELFSGAKIAVVVAPIGAVFAEWSAPAPASAV